MIAIKVPPAEPSKPPSIFADYFDEHPRITPGCEIDVLKVLQSSPKSERVETIRKSIQELSSDGKLLARPSNQEHVLFEGAMYVCVHLFKTARGTRSTEVYLWIGSSVPQAASEDGQVFARKIAKDHGGKLQLVPQGKEPSTMFQALGGIIITFRQRDGDRGLPSRFMLCGRHHLGHMSFDALDFAPGSLCSGFPYLVRGGSSLFLWAGAGCTVEELDCARLVAMDLLAASADPGAAFLEIKDGDEPPAFLDLFADSRAAGRRPPRIPPSASHWRLKPAVGARYSSRLFRISQRSASTRKAGALQVGHQLLGWASNLLPSPTADAATAGAGSKPTSPVKDTADFREGTADACEVEELVPFDCADLRREGGVWVLDAFFEMYMYVKSQPPTKANWSRILPPNPHAHASAFAAALLFAQAYGILAASEDDRPFVPVTTVVLDGAPRDLRAAFRRWTAVPVVEQAGRSGLSRKGSLRVVALATALAAVQR
jgi:hypothetical protein